MTLIIIPKTHLHAPTLGFLPIDFYFFSQYVKELDVHQLTLIYKVDILDLIPGIHANIFNKLKVLGNNS
jgi:hypothetical protein